MSSLLPNSFASYAMSDFDVVQGSMYTTSQLEVLQNHLSSKAEERLSLEYDPLNPIQFAQREAELKGAIQFIQYLIDTSTELSSSIVDNLPST